MQKLPGFFYERKVWKKGYKAVAGTDEVGRGCFAGPVVAACVIFPQNTISTFKGGSFKGYAEIIINDSKRMRPRQREKSAGWIKQNSLSWGIGEASTSDINRLGMAKATKRAFRQAVAEANKRLEVRSLKLDREVGNGIKSKFSLQNPVSSIHLPASEKRIQYLLIDAFFIPYIPGLPTRRKKTRRQLPIIHGDQKSLSIAAASIIAKVYRDKLMLDLSKKPKYKKYGWGRNKGYGTKEHQQAIIKYGPTRYHRKQFVETFLKNYSN